MLTVLQLNSVKPTEEAFTAEPEETRSAPRGGSGSAWKPLFVVFATMLFLVAFIYNYKCVLGWCCYTLQNFAELPELPELPEPPRPAASRTLQSCQNFAELAELAELPIEIIVMILSVLDPQSLVQAALTCRLWHQVIQETDALWKNPCLFLRTVCQREIDSDRLYGLSWQVTLVRNYPRSILKRDWLRGRYTNVRSADELRGRSMVSLDLEAWGEILDAELER